MDYFEIDLNVRIRKGWTFNFVQPHEVEGVSVGDTVRVVEPETGIHGYAVVKAIETDKYETDVYVELDVDWEGLRLP